MHNLQAFTSADQDMDGEAIADAFGTFSGPDCIKDVLPKFGQRVKVYNAIKLSLGREITSEVSKLVL